MAWHGRPWISSEQKAYAGKSIWPGPVNDINDINGTLSETGPKDEILNPYSPQY